MSNFFYNAFYKKKIIKIIFNTYIVKLILRLWLKVYKNLENIF